MDKPHAFSERVEMVDWEYNERRDTVQGGNDSEIKLPFAAQTLCS